jgi:hypothetical protein
MSIKAIYSELISLELELIATQFQFISHIRDQNAEFVPHDSA